MTFAFLQELLSLAEAYEQSGGPTQRLDREDFVSWLLNSRRSREGNAPVATENGPSPNGLIAMYLSFMARYAQFYSRRLFKDSTLYSEDDWGVLVSLYPYGKSSKTEVIKRCIMEKSSGNEVLKRMLRVGLLQEESNPEDGRSKLIALTDAGRTAFESVQNGIQRLSNLVVADLEEAEKQQLLQILLKLHRFHKPVFEEGDEEALVSLFWQA